MPDHFHGIIRLEHPSLIGTKGSRFERSGHGGPILGTRLSEVVQAFKSLTTNLYIQGVRKGEWPAFERHFWQRNYYERIIRDADELLSVKNYIRSNPSRWTKPRQFEV